MLGTGALDDDTVREEVAVRAAEELVLGVAALVSLVVGRLEDPVDLTVGAFSNLMAGLVVEAPRRDAPVGRS